MADSDLLPVADPLVELQRGTFVAVQLKDGRRLVGTFKTWLYYEYTDIFGEPTGADVSLSLELPNGALVEEGRDQIDKVWYAPMGYRG
jgi:hypothetical protein